MPTVVPAKKKTASRDQTLKIGSREITITNYDKLYWPEEKITKGQLIEYYMAIAPTILPYLKNRPLSLKRNPNGITDKGFFQKDAPEHTPSFIKTFPVLAESTGQTVDYIICNDAATLIYLANLGCIEMNPWNSTTRKPDSPTYMIIDVDPSPKNNFNQVIETVQVTCDVLDKIGASFFCKTSGATGMHVYIPLNAKYSYEQARRFGEIIASKVHEQLPSFTSLERSLAKRGNKIYVDYLQNSRGQTLACAYSARPVAGAQVSTPVLQKEIKPGLHPSQFNIFNTMARVKKLGDVFFMALGKGIDLQACLKKIDR